MLKAIFIYEKRQRVLLPHFLELIFNSEKRIKADRIEILDLLRIEKPKLVFFDFENPMGNEGDINNFISQLSPEIQLNVSIIRISPSNFKLLRAAIQKIIHFFRDHFGHHGRGSGIKEAFVKR